MPLIERVLDRDPCVGLDEYLARGGGRGLDAARRLGPAGVIDEVEASGLRGRGGAGFPTGVKWRTVAAARSVDRPTPVVVNAAEGEPGTFKDRALLRANPYKVIEGALIAAVAMESTEVVVGVKGSFAREVELLRTVADEIRAAGWAPGVSVRIVEGPEEYLLGEETGLLEVIEGRPPFPRVAPPYRRGIDASSTGNPSSDVELAAAGGTAEAPALVDNAETIANLPGLLAQGADWFRSVGTPESPGTLICTISGRTRRHAVGEVPMGTPLREAIELIGEGPLNDRRITGAMSGVANPILPEHLLDTPLTYEAMNAVGSGLGAGGFFVFDDETDPVAVAYAASRFLAVESCGQCLPCKRDGLSISTRLGAIASGEGTQRDLEELPRLLDTVTDGARCFLANQQERVVRSALALFPDAFRRHLEPTAGPVLVDWILPIVDIEGDQAVFDVSLQRKQPDWSYDATDSGALPAELYGSEPLVLEVPSGHEGTDVVTDELAPRPSGPDPLEPLLDMHRGIRAALDRVGQTEGAQRAEAIGDLRNQLRLHDDVSRRVVHPMASRYAGAPADDARWDAENEEADAEARLRRLDEIGVGDAEKADWLDPLVGDIREALDRNEAKILELLRANMDDQELSDLGNAIYEACATSRVNVG